MKSGNALIAIAIAPVIAFGAAFAVQAQKAPSTSHEMTLSHGKYTETVTTTASVRIASIDRAKRIILLKHADGRITEMLASPQIRNFDQLKAGDKVRARYIEALSLELKKAGTAKASGSDRQYDIMAPAGAKPAAATGRVVRATADVVATDAHTQMVSLRGPKGHTVDLHVPTPSQFSNIKVGDHVEVVYAEAMAVKVEPAA